MKSTKTKSTKTKSISKNIQRKTRKQKLNKSRRRTIIKTFLQFLNCTKLYHWSTSSYSQHKATDEEFRVGLLDFILIRVLMHRMG